MELTETLTQIDELKSEIDTLRPINQEQERRVLQKLRLEWNYHSNALEGNSLSLGETRVLLLQGITAHGKPLKDYLDIRGHDEAILYLEEFVRQQHSLTEADIRELHKILLVEPYEVDAITPDGLPAKKLVAIGQYKTTANNVRTSTGEIHYYATPEETPAKMGDLMKWYHQACAEKKLHPLVIAATFHYQFVSIHPFDDGNGRMARLLMNLILMQFGYVPVVVRIDDKPKYLLALETADEGELKDFIIFIGQELLKTMGLYLRGVKGDLVDDLGDLEKRVALLQQQIESELSDNANKERVIFKRKQQFFRNLVKPLLESTSEQFSKFEVLFKNAAYFLTVNETERRNLDRDTFIRQLSTWSDTNIHQISAEFSLISLINHIDDNLVLRIRFNLENTNFAITYSLHATTISVAMEYELLTGDYEHHYSSQEIDSFVYILVEHTLGAIEQLANRS